MEAMGIPRTWVPYSALWLKADKDKTPACDKCGKTAEYMAVKLSPYQVQMRCKRCAK